MADQAARQLESLCVDRQTAADLLGLSPASLDSAVARGDLPAPLTFGRRKVWYLRALRERLDTMAGIAPVSGEDPWLKD